MVLKGNCLVLRRKWKYNGLFFQCSRCIVYIGAKALVIGAVSKAVVMAFGID